MRILSFLGNMVGVEGEEDGTGADADAGTGNEATPFDCAISAGHDQDEECAT